MGGGNGAAAATMAGAKKREKRERVRKGCGARGFPWHVVVCVCSIGVFMSTYVEK
jgi:hypothetical protein